MTLGNAAIYSLLGVCVVFFALILLMIAIKILVKVMPYKEAAAPAPAVKAAEAPAPEKKAEPAKGVAGDLKLIKTEPRDAAMIMAIIADELKTPLNQLRFKSIKLVEEEGKR
jgi:Na+-transporting methylmalonyl-CoA/oxaloacetate decarboxylase gamma subunit